MMKILLKKIVFYFIFVLTIILLFSGCSSNPAKFSKIMPGIDDYRHKLSTQLEGVQKNSSLNITDYSRINAEKDSDDDGIYDSKDKCPNTPKYTIINWDGCNRNSAISNKRYIVKFQNEQTLYKLSSSSAVVNTAMFKQMKVKEKNFRVKRVNEKDEIILRLKQWERAWEKGDIETYLSMYSKQYKGALKNRLSWIKDRKQKIKPTKKISLELSGVKIKKDKKIENKLVVRFKQKYSSTTFYDQVHKQLFWEKINDTWVIKREHTI